MSDKTNCPIAMPEISSSTRKTMDLSRSRMRDLVEGARFRYAVLVLIFLNAIILGLETSSAVMDRVGSLLHLVDGAILVVFVLELLLRLYAHGLRFFRDPWGVFDFLVISVGLIPASSELTVLRALRVLRAIRLVSGAPRLRRVVEALFQAIPGIGAIAALLLLLFYIFSVIGTKLYGESFPQWFGTIGESMYSLFQILTLESWSMGIVRPIMEAHPYAWTFFVPFIVTTSFAVLNLFIAVIVDSMQRLHAEEDRQSGGSNDDFSAAEISELRGEIRALREEIVQMRQDPENAR